MSRLPAARHVLVLLGSTRPDGNSERMARIATAGLPDATPCTWWRLAERPLPPFRDRRHEGGFGPAEGTAAELLEATLRATDLVLASPVYWYALPAPVKLYLDHWTAWLKQPGLDFQGRMRGKRLWALLSDAADPGEESADLVVEALARTAAYLDMAWMGAVVGHGSAPGDVLQDPDLEGGLRSFLVGPDTSSAAAGSSGP
ncbi:MAG: NAD(P)H-dependent oxidoreductase [Holophagaceae bacterium]